MLPLGRQSPGGHPTRFTHDEQRFLMTLWSIARAPLMLGAVLPLDPDDIFTLPLLTNPAVLAVNARSCENAPTPVLNADNMGLAAWHAIQAGDGSESVFALFNTREAAANVSVAVPVGGCITDLWTGGAEGKVESGGALTRLLQPHSGGMWGIAGCALA